MKKIILASSSSKRHEILKSIGIKDFVVLSPDINEARKKGEKPEALSKRLALEKNIKIREEAISKHGKNCIIISADTVAFKGRDVLEKAETDEDIEKYMKKISGSNHRVCSSFCIFDVANNKEIALSSLTRVKVKSLTNFDITQMVQSKTGIGKAGGYQINEFFRAFTEKIVGSITNVEGIDACKLRNTLISLGFKNFEI